MIKAFICDFGQTLVDSSEGFRRAEKELQSGIFEDIGLASREDFISNYRRLRKEFHDISNFSRRAVSKAVYCHFRRSPDEKRLDVLEDNYWKSVTAATREFPEARQVLKALSNNYRLALITNTQGQKSAGDHRIAQFPELTKFFEIITIAGELDVPEKPDPAPFRLCLSLLGVEPEEAVFIGDDWRIDICGARNAGMHPIWLQHRSVKRSWPVVETSVPIIHSLDDLLNLEKLIASGRDKPV